MNQRRISGLLAVGSLILLGIGIFLYVTSDREGPVISIPETALTYREGMDQSQLLEGVTAYDNRDQDVTNSIRIEKVIAIETSSEARVVYVAKDKSNNITKEEVVLPYVTGQNLEEPKEEVSEEETTLTSEETLGNTEESNDLDDTRREPSSDENIGETEVAENGDIINLDTSELVSTGEPIIRLNRYKIHLSRGANLNTMNYVQEVKDDRDNTNDLYKRIRVEGTYDMQKKGTYELTYYVTDSDGNESNVEKLTVVVD